MQVIQTVYIKSDEVQSLNFDTVNYFIRLKCGSEITIDKLIIERLQACEQAEKDFNERQSKI